MNDVEDKLRRAMRPIDPPEGFAERVMRALPAREPPAPVVVLATVPRAPRTSAWRRFSTPVTLAASLVVGVLVGKQMALEHQREGIAASRELMQALRVTSQKLDAAYQAVQGPPPAPDADEENQS
jgi:negative regulator of sigma E activity